MCKRPEKCNGIFKYQFEIIQTPVWNIETTICETNPPFETETRVENLKCCILLHLIYHKDKTGVMYSKRCNIAYVVAYCCIRYITRTKLVLCIQKDAISPFAFAYRCTCYITRTKLVLCIQNGAISPYAFAYRCNCYITRTKLVLCIQNGTVSPLEFVYKVQMLKLKGLCTCMRVY